jgi:drug/metabolite transporter (DMT)-like permease
MMPISALLLALASAVLHAIWNLLLGRARDLQAATAATFVLALAFALPFAVIWWQADRSVWPYALASTLLEIAYVLALVRAYRISDISFAYPVSRGLAPVLALVASVLVLSHHATPAEGAGVVLVGLGVILVGSRRGPAAVHAQALLVATVLAATIAAYTLVDRAGIQRAGALTYFVLTLAGPCLVYPPLVGARAMRNALDRLIVLAALANLGSFTLGLLALRYGSAAAVLAVRSSSVVIATVLAARLLSEQVSRRRVAGSVLVFAGVALLAV